MLVLNDADVRSLVTPEDAIRLAVELFSSPARAGDWTAAAGLTVEGGRLVAASAVAGGLGRASVEALGSFASDGTLAVSLVLASDHPRILAAVESPWLAGLAAGATSAVGARQLARRDARTVGAIGCGQHAAAEIACLRAALPVERVVAYCRGRGRLEAFCADNEAEPADYGRELGDLDIVVTATTSPDPVLRGDWLHPGSLVCAAGTVTVGERELDNAVLKRAAFVCCDSRAAAAARAGDLVEPVERGVLDWLEVHELVEVVDASIEGRQTDADIVVLKVTGLATLRLALASLAADRAVA